MKKILPLICILLISTQLYSQKVGLVLSGGGAKGIAHIGLIKVLEDNNIPIDYVAGTSIGAIIAGLYASGMSPDEMLELFNSDDFMLWSTGKMDKDDLFYFQKKDESPEWLSLDISKKEDKIKLLLPTNLVPERQMDFAFMQITAQTTAICNRDFDKLFVPFRSVSTDIYHNKAVIHRSGDLGLAIRASMTFPLVYKPIELDGLLLFDGGIINNFPWDVMYEDFKPDIIIAHKVTNMGEKPDPDDVFSQIESMVTQTTSNDLPDSLGFMLETKLNEVGLLDFPKANYINSKGIETGLSIIDSIAQTIERRVPKQAIQERRKAFIEQKPELLFNNIQVEGVKENSKRSYIIQSIKSGDSILTLDQLRSSYFKLISDKQIKSIQPLAYYNSYTDLFDLHLKVKPSKPFDIGFGGHISTRANTFGYLEGNYKVFKNRAYVLSSNLYFGRFYNSFQIGGRIDNPTKIPFYISGYYTLNLLDYSATSTDLIFTDIKPSYIKQSENNARIEAGLPYSKHGIIDAGISWSRSNDRYYQTTIFNEGDELDETNFEAYSTHLRVDNKNYDYRVYPTEGSRKLFTLQYINGYEQFTPGNTAPIQAKSSRNHSYFQIRALFDQYFKTNRYITLGLMAEAKINNNKLFSNYTASALNAQVFAPNPNSHSMYNDRYRAYQYFALGGKLLYNISPIVHFRTEFYSFLPIQNIEKGELQVAKFSENIFPKVHFMGMGGLVVQTRVGPLSIEVDYYEKPGQKWFFSVNMGYMLFNKRGY
ncbi:MAG: patatin-like phospholipase family protein [Prolixibacteraceae bacterium]|nr:patatin-like phospholipase family protein [Prolixibacteraceae bacterium]MBN2648870.1 patatin-like phospholipase family protein [Prolixibacteraceae bacterium]